MTRDTVLRARDPGTGGSPGSSAAKPEGGAGTPSSRTRVFDPHRNWHVFSLGADLVEYGLSGHDADAMMALRAMPGKRLAALLLHADEQMGAGASAGDLLRVIVSQYREELEADGLRLAWARRWCRYHEELANWRSQSAEIKAGRWRERPMTAGQRALVQVTAGLLRVEIPEGLTRGTAADWLEHHGANLSYRQER